MLVDAHCHLFGKHLATGKLEPLLERARRAGVGGFIAVGTELDDATHVLDLARTRPDVQASLGLHPHEASSWTPEIASRLEAWLADPNVRFVGETGLDWHYDFSPRESQERAFRDQIRLARRFGKPLMIHTREAGLETLRLLREEGAQEAGGVVHCFSEDRAFAGAVLDLGFYLSFSGIITFKNAAALCEIAAWAPGDRILVETDTPYLAPVPHRGKTNEPAFVTFVAERLASLRGISLHQLSDLTRANLERLCGWAPSC